MNVDVAQALWELHTTGRLGDDTELAVRETLEVPDYTAEPEDEASPQTKTTTTTGGKRT